MRHRLSTSRDPTRHAQAMGEALAVLKCERVPFEVAWERVSADHPLPADWIGCAGFMRQHFKAAYEGTSCRKGRLAVAAPDTHEARGAQGSAVVPRERQCRSGDGCDRPATRGRFGLKWCEHHGAELERLWDVPAATPETEGVAA